MWFKQHNSNQQFNAQIQLDELGSNGVELNIDELIYYQNKLGLIDLASTKNLHGKMSGNYLARSKGRGMEFDEVRHYQTGDDIRAIDWRVTARTGKTHTKLFREEVERPVLIATDLSETMYFGSQLLFKSVQAAHLAALIAWHAKARGDRVGGIIFNQQQHQELKPRSRHQAVLHYLHALVTTHNQTLKTAHHKQTFANNCARLRHLARPGSLVYLITDAFHLNDESVRHLAQITQHCELVVCIIKDPLELALPHSKQKISLAVTEGQRQQTLVLGDEKLAKRYQQQAIEINECLEQKLTKAGARLLHFSAGQSLAHQLRSGEASWTR